MQIKQQMLAQHAAKKIAPCYVLIGQDNYLLEESFSTIKAALKKIGEYDEKIMSIQSAEDWNTIAEEANSYSLFADIVLLNIFYDKKTIDAAGKKVLTHYLNSVNSRCFIIIRAPNVPAKQLQWLVNSDQATVVVAYPLHSDAMKQWIGNELKKKSMLFEPQVPDLIHQYTQGNMLACAQVIEKLTLTHDPGSTINSSQALEHLSDQCDHNLFELIDACLLGQADKAVHILRQAANNKTETTLVLWMLTQEVRILIQLSNLMQRKVDFKTATSQLKIWAQRVNLYQSSLRRMNRNALPTLLLYCQAIDERIKSNLNTQVWNALEKLSISLCTGKLLGDSCAV